MKIGDLVTWRHPNAITPKGLFIVVKVAGSLGDLVICHDVLRNTRTTWLLSSRWRLV
jgi:hypothetical protein